MLLHDPLGVHPRVSGPNQVEMRSGAGRGGGGRGRRGRSPEGPRIEKIQSREAILKTSSFQYGMKFFNRE